MHYSTSHETQEIAFRPGYLSTDFEQQWMKTTEFTRDHAGSQGIKVRSLTEGNYTKAMDAKYRKLYMDDKAKDVPDRFMEWPGQYECHAVMLGIVKWMAIRKVKKVVDHHIKEVAERRYYKSRPKTPLKGSTLYAIGKFRVSYDGREYDPLEH